MFTTVTSESCLCTLFLYIISIFFIVAYKKISKITINKTIAIVILSTVALIFSLNYLVQTSQKLRIKINYTADIIRFQSDKINLMLAN
jgi:hypothetical protein